MVALLLKHDSIAGKISRLNSGALEGRLKSAEERLLAADRRHALEVLSHCNRKNVANIWFTVTIRFCMLGWLSYNWLQRHNAWGLCVFGHRSQEDRLRNRVELMEQSLDSERLLLAQAQQQLQAEGLRAKGLADAEAAARRAEGALQAKLDSARKV
eukprot:355645-Chlamydomonas_euryale.AAC.39